MDGFAAFEHLFIGQDPLRIARHVRALETIGFHAGRYWPLEAALWDLAGKVTGQPVAVLFGGATDALPAYASTGERRAPAERAASARRDRRRRVPGDEAPDRPHPRSTRVSRPSARCGTPSATGSS